MVTYIKIGSCDELKEWGKYDPIPATTECCCCGTTVIDIITPNKDKPIVVPDKPSDSSSSSETKPSTDTSTTTPSDNTASGSTDNSGTTTPSTPSTGDTTTPSDSGANGNTDTNTTPSNQDDKQITNTFNLITKYGSSDNDFVSIYAHDVTGHKGDTIKLWDYFKEYIKKDENGKYYVDALDDKYIYTGNDDLMTATRTLENDGATEYLIFSLPKSSNDGSSSTSNTDTGSTSNPTYETKPSTPTDSDSTGNTETSSSSQTEPSKPAEKKITNTFNLTYENSDTDNNMYYTFTVSGNKGDVVNIWDYIKDKVKKNDKGKYYITVDGNDYIYSENNDISDETRTLEYDGDSEDFIFSDSNK